MTSETRILRLTSLALSDRPRTSLFGAILNTLLIWQERAAQRHRLAHAEARLLRDMGLSDEDARREAGKPFWRA